MEKLSSAEKYLYSAAILAIVASGALGYYLVDGEPKMKGLVASGHNHLVGFAMSAILFGYLLRFLDWGRGAKFWMSLLMSLTFFGPLALIYAGFIRDTSFLKYTSPIFDGGFVVLWAVLFLGYLLVKTDKK